MPTSCQISRKKTKTKVQLLCDSVDKAIDDARSEIANFSRIKKEVGYEPGLLQEAVEKNLVRDEDLRQVMAEQKQWKDEVKRGIRADVMAEKQRLKMERKVKRHRQSPSPGRKAPQKRRRAPGKFI